MTNNLNIKIENPLILWFEYNKNEYFVKSIIDYINNKNIQTIQITNLIPIKYIKQIKSQFISVDIDYFEFRKNIFNKLLKYNGYVWQIRLNIEWPFIINDIIIVLDKLKQCFKGSIIILYKNNISNIDTILIQKLISNILSKKVVFSFFPILDVNENDLKYINIINLLEKNKNNILNWKILLDNPKIYKQITWNSVICPNNFWIHIDYYWNVKLCKYSNIIIWNIKNNNISYLYDLKQQYQKNLKFKDCFIYNENTIYPYQILSKFYDYIMWNKEKLYNKYLEILIELWISQKRSILDLWAWTGNFLYFLKTNWFLNINWIEKSKDMLEIANIKLWKKLVLKWDFTNFKFTKKIDIITSTFDSINYVKSIYSFERIFKNIYKNLKNNWYFIFDINTSKKFKNHFNLIQEYNHKKNKIYFISSYRNPFWKIKIDFLDSNNAIFSESHFEILKSKIFFLNLLKKINFNIIKYKEDKWRLLLVCQKI